MKIWAHRGCSYAWPENTLEAFVAACKLPVEGIELDIQLSRDGRLVVIHDETVDRTTDGSGNVAEFTFGELRRLRIQTHSSEDGQKCFTCIPSMEEVFELIRPYCLKKGLLLNIELKNNVIPYEGMEDKILNMAEQFGVEEYIVYSSFNPDSVRLIKEKNPAARTGILASPVSACLEFAKSNPVDALHPYVKNLDITDLRAKTGLPVRAWNVKTYEPFYPSKDFVELQDLEELENAGVTDIFTNVPERYLNEERTNAL